MCIRDSSSQYIVEFVFNFIILVSIQFYFACCTTYRARYRNYIRVGLYSLESMPFSQIWGKLKPGIPLYPTITMDSSIGWIPHYWDFLCSIRLYVVHIWVQARPKQLESGAAKTEEILKTPQQKGFYFFISKISWEEKSTAAKAGVAAMLPPALGLIIKLYNFFSRKATKI